MCEYLRPLGTCSCVSLSVSVCVNALLFLCLLAKVENKWFHRMTICVMCMCDVSLLRVWSKSRKAERHFFAQSEKQQQQSQLPTSAVTKTKVKKKVQTKNPIEI